MLDRVSIGDVVHWVAYMHTNNSRVQIGLSYLPGIGLLPEVVRMYKVT